MLKFLWNGIIRDKRRSLLPVIVVMIGVCAAVILTGFIDGMMNNMVSMTAHFDTGHVKVITRAYEKDIQQKPLDCAILNSDKLVSTLKSEFPDMDWTQRIYFGGLLDIPDSLGETKAQGPVSVTAYDLLSPGSKEANRIHIQQALVGGHLISTPGEILISSDFAKKFNVNPNDTVTFFGSTMDGSMSFFNYRVAGMIHFGVPPLDKGAVIIDISDARQLLDMDNACGEIFGFLPEDKYERTLAENVKNKFNSLYVNDTDEYAPVMIQLTDQNAMGEMLDYIHIVSSIMISILILALSIVLWNTGLLGGIRRYNEFGLRLALGEEKKHIYRTLLAESLLIGCIGSVIGTALGLGVAALLQKYGIDYSKVMDNLSMMIDPVIRADITPEMFYIGFIPGVISMFIGSALSGRAIYKRSTAALFKELE